VTEPEYDDTIVDAVIAGTGKENRDADTGTKDDTIVDDTAPQNMIK